MVFNAMDTVRTLGQSVYPDIALDISNYYISITSQENFCVLRYTYIRFYYRK